MAEQNVPAQPDIITKLGKHLDRHLVFPLLEFLSSKEVSPDSTRTAAVIRLPSEAS